jgi:hypothetical protein
MTSMSEMSGTLRKVHLPRARMVAAISFNAEFLAPEMRTSPLSVPFPRTLIIS